MSIHCIMNSKWAEKIPHLLYYATEWLGKSVKL